MKTVILGMSLVLSSFCYTAFALPAGTIVAKNQTKMDPKQKAVVLESLAMVFDPEFAMQFPILFSAVDKLQSSTNLESVAETCLEIGRISAFTSNGFTIASQVLAPKSEFILKASVKEVQQLSDALDDFKSRISGLSGFCSSSVSLKQDRPHTVPKGSVEWLNIKLVEAVRVNAEIMKLSGYDEYASNLLAEYESIYSLSKRIEKAHSDILDKNLTIIAIDNDSEDSESSSVSTTTLADTKNNPEESGDNEFSNVELLFLDELVSSGNAVETKPTDKDTSTEVVPENIENSEVK